MFDNVKKLYQLKKMQDEFKREKLTFESEGVTVTMNGNFEVENIILNPELDTIKQQEILKKCLNNVREDIQKTLAKKMMSSGFAL